MRCGQKIVPLLVWRVISTTNSSRGPFETRLWLGIRSWGLKHVTSEPTSCLRVLRGGDAWAQVRRYHPACHPASARIS